MTSDEEFGKALEPLLQAGLGLPQRHDPQARIHTALTLCHVCDNATRHEVVGYVNRLDGSYMPLRDYDKWARGRRTAASASEWFPVVKAHP